VVAGDCTQDVTLLGRKDGIPARPSGGQGDRSGDATARAARPAIMARFELFQGRCYTACHRSLEGWRMSGHTITSFEGCAKTLRQGELRQSLYDAASLTMERLPRGSAWRRTPCTTQTSEATVFRKNVFVDYEKNIMPETLLRETLDPFLVAGKGDRDRHRLSRNDEPHRLFYRN